MFKQYPAFTMIDVAHKLVLSNQHVKGWIPDSKVVDGIEFVELNQWDRKFFRFCTGKFLTFRKGQGHMAHTKFYDYLLERRTTTSRDAFEAARRRLQEAAEGGAPPRKKKIRACRMSDAAVSGEIVACDLDYRGDVINMKMLFGIRNQRLWVEASAANMQYVANGINHDWMAGISSPLGHNRTRGGEANANAAVGAEEGPDGGESAGEDTDADIEDVDSE